MNHSKLDNIKASLGAKKLHLASLLKKKEKLNSSLESASYEKEVYSKTSLLLLNASSQAKEEAISILETIVTNALQDISGSDYSFKVVVEDTKKGQKCEFYIVEKVNEGESMQSVTDACGGGFIDIISTTLRYVYLNTFNSPRIKGPLILDEPAKMLSKDMSLYFASFVKSLGEEFNRQTILITHNEDIAEIADNTIKVGT